MTVSPGSNSSAQLRHICSRLVTLEEGKSELDAEIKETKAKAKSDGFDPSIITKTVRLMRMDEVKRKKALDQHDLFSVYASNVGLTWDREEAPKESPEERGERLGRAGDPPDSDDDAFMRGFYRGNKERLEATAQGKG